MGPYLSSWVWVTWEIPWGFNFVVLPFSFPIVLTTDNRGSETAVSLLSLQQKQVSLYIYARTDSTAVDEEPSYRVPRFAFVFCSRIVRQRTYQSVPGVFDR